MSYITPAQFRSGMQGAKDYADSLAFGGGVNEYVGATDTIAGTKGLLPAASIGQTKLFFRSDGTWVSIDTQIKEVFDSEIGVLLETEF